MDIFHLQRRGHFKLTMTLLVLIGLLVLCDVYKRKNKPTDKPRKEISHKRNQNEKSLRKNNCKGIMKVNVTELPKDYLDLKSSLNEVIRKYGGLKIGHMGLILKKELDLFSLLKTRSFSTVCETGFNAGHSSLMWLYAGENTKVYSFDLGAFKYSKPAAKLLQDRFPGRLKITWGDSKKTVPEFTKKNPEVKCDLLSVDGGHNYPEASHDMKNLRKHAKDDSSLLIVDDTIMPGVSRAWKEQEKEGKVRAYCSYKGNFKQPNGINTSYSITFGQYIGQF